MDVHFRKHRNRLLKRQDGVVALEFAILFPLFLLVVAGIVEFGHLFYVRHTLTNASREGARAGVVYVSMTDTERIAWAENAAIAAVNNYLKPVDAVGVTHPRLPGVTLSDPAVQVVAVSGFPAGHSGSAVIVTITATDVLLVLDKFNILSNPINVTAETTMRLE